MTEKVLFLQKTFELGGGVEKVHSNLGEAMLAQGQGVFFHMTSASNRHLESIENFSQSFNVSYTLESEPISRKLLTLFELIRKEQITSVIAATETANIIGLACKIRFPSLKLLFTRHCAFDVSGQNLGPSTIKLLYSVYTWFGKVVAVSRELETQLKSKRWIHKTRIHYIPNAAATLKNHSLASENTENWPYKQYFLGVGRLVEQKGFDMLIKAYKRALDKNKQLPQLISRLSVLFCLLVMRECQPF
jgi:glycosyltransferase involved in cell wall biosynthesis